MANPAHRIYTFDLLRGIAVLTMMVAHGVYFFHSRDSAVLLSLENFGNTVSFVTFLVVSGAVTWIAFFGRHRQGQPVNRRRVFTRVLLFLLAYYVLAIVMAGRELLAIEGFARLRLIFNILSFRFLPGFTEYFPPFIFYSALIGLMPRIFSAISRRLFGVIGVSLAAWLLGWWLYQLPVGPTIKPWLALLAGGEGLFRFPILQYLPVFLMGLYWGHRTHAIPDLSSRQRFIGRAFWWLAVLTAAAYVMSFATDIPRATIFMRWPPTIPFLGLGLGFAFFVAWVLYALHQLRRLRFLRDMLLTFGQNALGLFWSHVFLLGLYAAADGPKVSSIWVFLFLWIVLLLLSLALTTFLPFNFRFALTSIRGSQTERDEALEGQAVFDLSKDVASEAVVATKGFRQFFFPYPRTTSRRILRKRHKLGISLVVLVAAIFVFPATTEEISLQQQSQGSELWWSDAYAYRQHLTLQNPESFVTLQPGTPVEITLDHRTLVEQGKSRADGLDLKVVYWTGKSHLVIDSSLRQPDSQQTKLTFRIPSAIEGQKPEQFYSIYYGGFVATSPSAGSLEPQSSVLASFESEDVYPFLSTVSSAWSLVGVTRSESITFSLTTEKPYEGATVTYQIIDHAQTGAMLSSSENSWTAIVPIGSLPPGAYQIQASLNETSGQIHTSQLTGFYRSHPLYVSWTQDWEGYDANQRYLDAIEAIAKQFELPITHYYNPRVFITETVAPQRARALVQWLQRRFEQGDGFGLHLHLFHDFVEQAGVTVRTEPNWGDRGDGYGVPLSAYTADEQKILIQKALDLTFANGLPSTKLFRAGGWFANLDTLRVLEDLGFTVDSSARTKYQFGRNRLPGHWDILATTQPYRPSRTNQNRTSSNPFPVLEIPNNGADSYAFSAQAMIDRFTLNFEDGILDAPQQVTYLSHPHWFDEAEQGRIREVLTYINRYNFARDHGPVIYATAETIANVFKDVE